MSQLQLLLRLLLPRARCAAQHCWPSTQRRLSRTQQQQQLLAVQQFRQQPQPKHCVLPVLVDMLLA
jgi:hypothetical protein